MRGAVCSIGAMRSPRSHDGRLLPDASEAETICEALADPTRARFFTEVATDPEWIDWLDKHGYLAPLFTGGTLRECDAPLAAWLVDKFAFTHPKALFLLIGRHDMILNPQLWQDLARTLAYRTDSPLDDETLSRWVSCLLATAPPLRDMHLLLSLGQRCIQSGLVHSLLETFDMMARHGLYLKPPFLEIGDDFVADFDLPEQDIDLELSQEGNNSALNELWETGLKPHVDVVAEPLLSSVAVHLAARHRTFFVWQKADPERDPESFGRDAIEPHEQGPSFRPCRCSDRRRSRLPAMARLQTIRRRRRGGASSSQVPKHHFCAALECMHCRSERTSPPAKNSITFSRAPISTTMRPATNCLGSCKTSIRSSTGNGASGQSKPFSPSTCPTMRTNWKDTPRPSITSIGCNCFRMPTLVVVSPATLLMA